eukprot:TRINITY_DN14333_c0_g1_i2.p1 TRINITY_DN14333_c0_g1~~TRINITY_DN14333_c0_g1_i2.p1  ORF type:complete len:245 (+),score=45.92 TRINITY_DN14333_c0_g1_i2:370-1104(+)
MHKEAKKESGFSFINLARYIKEHTLYNRTHYLVFDNLMQILNRKLFKKLLSFKYELRSRIRVILICDGFIPKTKFCDESILLDAEFVHMLMPSPSKKHLQVVLREETNKFSHPEAFPLFIDLLYAQYRQYTLDIVYYAYLCNTLLPVFLKDIGNDTLEEGEIHKLYNENFRRAAKLLINSLYLPIKDLSSISEETYYEVNNEQAYGYNIRNGLTCLEGVVLVAAYVACHNPEQTDIQFFTRQKT